MLGQEYVDVPYIGPPNVYRRRSGTDEPLTSRKHWVIAHNTSNNATDTAEAEYARRRTDASSHYYVDRDSITQSLHTDYCAGHVGSLTGNTYGIAYEFTGVNGWTRAQWLANINWDKAGRQLARDARRHEIPLVPISPAQLDDGMYGVTTHDAARRTWGGTTHTDPGPGFPMDHWLAVARLYYGGMQMDAADEKALIHRVRGVHRNEVTIPFGENGQPEKNGLRVQLDRIESGHGIVLDKLTPKLTDIATKQEKIITRLDSVTGTVEIPDEQLHRVLLAVFRELFQP